MKFASRLDRFGQDIFTILDEKRIAVGQSGKKIYNLSIGTPDFETPDYVKEALKKAADEPDAWKYPLHDLPELKEALCSYYKRRFGVELAHDEMMSTSGTQTGLGYIFLTCCNPGDVVLLPDPCYPGFEAAAYLTDCSINYYPLLEENDFVPELDSIDDDIAKKAKLIIVNFPSNPTGAIADDSFYEKLITWAKKNDVLVVFDNAYTDIVFDGNEGKSFLSYEGAKDVGVECFSLAKSFNVTGAGISFLTGRRDVIEAVRLLREHVNFGMFIPLQRAAIAALTKEDGDLEKQCAIYEERRNVFCKGLRDIGLKMTDVRGGMFVWVQIPERFHDSMEFCFELLENAGVLCTPGSGFGPHGEGYVRFALVMDKEELKGAVEAIRRSGLI
ncbi:pyridoxal phosphate-dependent aminotransferase [Oribacterium sp. WCC10]|uniref:pyridoxal phosphate-dependent aminotransferase n=1 Tax=Oribacterium sp. WCC10 TaxID=1855343 RepID=UPI0008EAE4D5|nr:aminotransferase class I/II-fold pyridoxal phosphate-dependent enzyme [Oribacterium sp. WCC10]SFG74963.1 LL-diaminopimelate aminotransferase [Oribacterium sp. WCC10]